MKKLLIMGGKPIGSTEIVKKAKEMGIYTIVTDFLSEEESPAKKIADEQWNISTADITELSKKAVENGVDGVIAGVHEFCIKKALELGEKIGVTSWCTLEQWEKCSNKKLFKEMCVRHGIPVARVYKKDDSINYPVIVKPADSDGSRGFSICHNADELREGVRHALEFSGEYLIEEYMQCNACIIHYTAVNGEIIFSGISDKYSEKLNGGSMVMALQLFPARDMEIYMKEINPKAIQMFKDLHIKNGPIWIEAFNDNGRFVFNEMALRPGGSMTNYPVEYYTGIDQIKLMLDASLGNDCSQQTSIDFDRGGYVILPIHIKPGTVSKIEGMDTLKELPYVNTVTLVHTVGDEIQNWGTAQQVFCYMHLTYTFESELKDRIHAVKNIIGVTDANGDEMLFYLLDTDRMFNE